MTKERFSELRGKIDVVDICTYPHKDNWRPLGKISSPIVGMCEGREGVLQTSYFLIRLLPENYVASKMLEGRKSHRWLPLLLMQFLKRA